MQFKLTDLMWLTAYFAVGAWLYSSGFLMLGVVWIATVFGFEIGTRTDYFTPLLTVCGMVLGLAVCVALMCSSTLTYKKLFTYGTLEIFQALLILAAWSVAGAIFYWLATRLKKRPRVDDGKKTQPLTIR